MAEAVNIGSVYGEVELRDLTQKAAESATRTIKALQGTVKSVSASIGSSYQNAINNTATGIKVGAAGIIGSFALIGKSSLDSAAKMETLAVALNTSFQGNEKLAKDAQKAITSFAAKTPFQLEEVLNGFLKLKNLGLDPSEKALTSYGDTASAMGKSLNDMIEAVADASVGEFERLKEFGIRASSEGDKVKFTFQGVTTEVGKNSAEIEDYLIKLGQTKFAGGMADQADTFSGILSTLKDTVDLQLASFAVDTGLLDLGKTVLKSLISGFENIDVNLILKPLREAFKGVGQVLKGDLGGVAKLSDVFDSVAGVSEETADRIASVVSDIILTLKKLSENAELVKGVLIGVAVAVAAVVLPALYSIAAGVIAAVAPFALIIAAVGGLYFAFQTNFLGIQDFVANLIDKFEDLKSGFSKIVSSPEIQGFLEIVREIVDQIRENLSKAFVDIRSTIENEVIPAFKEIWEAIKPVAEIILTVAGFIVGALVLGILKVVEVITGLLSPAFSLIASIITNVLVPVVKIVSQVFIAVKDAVIDLYNKAVPQFQALVEFVTGVFNALAFIVGFNWDLIKAAFFIGLAIIVGIGQAIGKVLSPIFEPLKVAGSSVLDFIRDVSAKLYEPISNFVNRVKDIGKGIFDGVIGGVKVGINAIIGLLNTTFGYINTNLIATLNKIPNVSIRSLPNIPKLESGTNYVPKDMLAFLHEGEKVVPKKFNSDAGADVGNNVNVYNTFEIGNLIGDAAGRRELAEQVYKSLKEIAESQGLNINLLGEIPIGKA